MKHLLGALGLLFVATATLIPACADNDSSIAVRGVLQPTLDTCQVTADITAPQFTNGAFDVAITSEYNGFLLVENQLVSRGDPNKLRTETSGVQLYAADVQIQDASGATLTRSDNSAAEYKVPIAGFIDAAVGGTPSVGITSVLMVDSATAGDLAKQMKAQGTQLDLVISIVIHARTLGGNEIESGTFAFPIRACYGCLVTCPTKASDPTMNDGHNCTNTSEDPVPNCRLGLDTSVDCRLCRENAACACTGK